METAPISLYLDLEDGQKADIENIARASIAFAQAIKELAYVIDPSLVIRIELVDSTEGSLSINAVIKDLRDNHPAAFTTLQSISIAALVWFTTHVGDYAFDKVADHVVADSGFSSEQQKQISDIVSNAIEKQVGQQQVRQVYQHLEKDEAVKSVGATTKRGERPHAMVPRSEFKKRASERVVVETVTSHRSRKVETTLTLVSPVLKLGNRRWKFVGPESEVEFGAYIKDADKMSQIVNGTLMLPMVGDIKMKVLLETIEDRIDGVWVPQERNVLEIRKIILPNHEQPLPLPRPNPKPNDSGKD